MLRPPRRRGSGQVNKAERIDTACRGDSWSDLAWERGEGFPLLYHNFNYFAQNMQNERKNVINSVNFLCFLKFSRANLRFFYFPA